MLKKTTGLLILIIVLILAFVFVKDFFEKEDSKQQGSALPPTVVTVATAQQKYWRDQIQATGTMSAFQGIMLKPDVSGHITQIFFKDGQDIQAGQPVVQIYPDIIAAELKQAESALELAKLDFARGAELYKKRVISKQDYDELTSTLEQDAAKVSQYKAELDQHNITAPFSGRLGLRQFDLGDLVTVGQDLVNLQQTDPIRVEFVIPQIYLGELALGQKVAVVPSSVKKQTYVGEVYAFDSAVNVSTRSLAARAKVPNKDGKLIPGTFVEVTLFAGEKKPVVVVPQTAVEYSPEGDYVYLVENNKAVKTSVKLGMRREDSIVITSGVNPGQVVVTAGQIKLVNGAPVKVEQSSSNNSGNSNTGNHSQQTNSQGHTSSQSQNSTNSTTTQSNSHSNGTQSQGSSNSSSSNSATTTNSSSH